MVLVCDSTKFVIDSCISSSKYIISFFADTTSCSLPENVRGDVKELGIVIDQLHLNFIHAGELILEIARRLGEDHVVKQDQICRKIKEFLKDKIQERKISEGWIEEYLPTEYKRKYKGKPKSQLKKTGDDSRYSSMWF